MIFFWNVFPNMGNIIAVKNEILIGMMDVYAKYAPPMKNIVLIAKSKRVVKLILLSIAGDTNFQNWYKITGIENIRPIIKDK